MASFVFPIAAHVPPNGFRGLNVGEGVVSSVMVELEQHAAISLLNMLDGTFQSIYCPVYHSLLLRGLIIVPEKTINGQHGRGKVGSSIETPIM